MTSIFLSHSHSDAALAACFERYLLKMTSQQVEIHRSSRDGSIEYGDSWIDWINERVTSSVLSFVLLTPSSFTSKWVLWEAGAVSGVRRLSEDEQRSVIPIQFALPSGENLGPFSSQQVADGLDESQVVAMSQSVLRQLRDRGMSAKHVDAALVGLTKYVSEFISEARASLREVQVFRREDLVSEWLNRLDAALSADNPEYVNAAKRWISVAFLGAGRADDESTPIDFRIHARLASGFIRIKNWEKAKAQLLLGRAISPRDMMILRELGRVQLELQEIDGALRWLAEMKELDPRILVEDPEALNLNVRILVQSERWKEAHELLGNASALRENDSYVANMFAISTLKVVGAEAARAPFRRLEQMEARCGGRGIWTLGNLVNSSLGLAQEERATELLSELREIPEAQAHRGSISRYFDDIVDAQPDFQMNWRSIWPNPE